MQQALRGALKARDGSATSALRSALGAIGNAEAVEEAPKPLAGKGSVHVAGAVAGLGAGEAERRQLTEADVAAIVRAEVIERQAAASEYERAGQAQAADALRQGTRALMTVLSTGT